MIVCMAEYIHGWKTEVLENDPVMLMMRMKSQALMNAFQTLGLALIQEIPV
jgi:hypothetical protein